MLDIIGNIKIDESDPHRVRCLIACLRSYIPMSAYVRFILNLDTPSKWLEQAVRKELESYSSESLLFTSNTPTGNYGKKYVELLMHGNNPFVLNFIEDHYWCAQDMGKVKALFNEMVKNHVDVCKASFWDIENKSCQRMLQTPEQYKWISTSSGNIFYADGNYQKYYGSQYGGRYFIGVNFITTRAFAIKFWGRPNIFSNRPHPYEIAKFDSQYEHVTIFPSFELTAAIDDDHGEPGSSLLSRAMVASIENAVESGPVSDDNKETQNTSNIDINANVFSKTWNDVQKIKIPNSQIGLFSISPEIITTGSYSNLLHDKIVRQFENEFANYVGAKYAVTFNSATSAIFLLLLDLWEQVLPSTPHINLPSIIPPVVPMAVRNAHCHLDFYDDVSWVGGSYVLYKYKNYSVIDSAQRVDKLQYAKEKTCDDDIMIFSHYPTKPVGSADGGTIVSNNREIIEHLRVLSFNGMSQEGNNWERTIKCLGHKMYMNSLQADIALRSLHRLDEKRKRLDEIKNKYNTAFNLSNTSHHLYRIMAPEPEILEENSLKVVPNKQLIESAHKQNIICGIHYATAHTMPVFAPVPSDGIDICPNSTFTSSHTVSIPYNENMTKYDIRRVIEFTKTYVEANGK